MICEKCINSSKCIVLESLNKIGETLTEIAFDMSNLDIDVDISLNKCPYTPEHYVPKSR